jgi:hypothetical protein
MKTILVSLVTVLFAVASAGTLTGRWESPVSPKGNATGVVFKDDNSFEGYVNKKPFVSGNYFFNATDSIFTFVDNGCNGVTGVYKVYFFSNGDSMRLTAIMDSCAERRAGMERLTLGRVKKN